MKLITQFRIFFIVLAITGLATSLKTAYDNDQIRQNADLIAKNKTPILNKAHQLKLAVVQVQQFLSDISATRGQDGLNDGIELATGYAKKFRRLIAQLKQLDSKHAQTYEAMSPVFEEYFATGKKMAQAYINGGPHEGNKLMSSFDAVAEKIGQQVDQFLKRVTTETSTIVKVQESLTSSSQASIAIGAVVILIGITLVYFMIARAMSNLPKISAEFKKIANGDLTSQIKVTRQDEYGELMTSLNSMQQKLREMVSRISDTTEKLYVTADQVTNVMSQTTENILNQQQETEQIAQAMNDMSSVIHEVSQKVTHTSETANSANTESSKGIQIVDDAISGIQGLENQLQSTATVISDVEKDSDNINTVLDVIKGIAEQTNLLALNAAIEAARAGEQGRGFAVVADEVRTLAGRTQESTTEINQIIEKLQSGSNHAVQSIQHSHQLSQDVVDKAKLAGSSLNNIAASVAEIDSMSSQIAVAATQQAEVAQNMNNNIERINGIVKETASGAQQTAKEGESLSSIAQELQQMVGVFHL